MATAHVLYLDPDTDNLIDHEIMLRRVVSGTPREMFTPVCRNCQKVVEQRQNGTFHCSDCKLDMIVPAAA